MTIYKMNRTRVVLAAWLFVLGLAICRANLGDTEAQCIARYGSESDVQTDVGYRQVGDKAASFNVKTADGAIAIRVIFLNGRSCHESVSNADASMGLSEDQLEGILKAQNAGLKWEKGRTEYHTGGGSTYGSIDWLRSDGATAKFWLSSKEGSESQTGQVDLSTKQYAVAQHFYDRENGEN